MQIKYYGHSCFGIHIGDKKILFDPFIRPNPLAKDIDVDAIEADYILISHAHFDHTADVLEIAKRTGAKIIASWEICEYYTGQGYTHSHAMNKGGFFDFDFGRLQMVTAVHSSSFADGTYGGTAAGYVLKTNEKTFYYAGDTALTLDMQLIADRHSLNFAFLPIGSNFTMDVTDAVTASKLLKCNHVIGMHYDTFGYITIDQQDAINRFNQAGKLLTLMNIGQTLEI